MILTRIPKVPIPSNVDRKQLIGDIKGNLMYDCVYNEIIAGTIDCTVPKCNDIEELLPVHLQNGYLESYQIEDLSKSLSMDRVFNINKPGYGKTLETILWIYITLRKNFTALILCPKSVIGTWEYQLNKYWPDHKKCGKWLITNYEQLYNKARLEAAKSCEWTIIVIDESHKIKSVRSKITQICYQLKSTFKHCLTGTPIWNRPEDLAAQLKWLDPYSITNFTDFQYAFCHMENDGWGWKAKGLTKNPVMQDNLKKLLDMYCVGGKEHNILEKPNYIKVRLKMDDKVKKLYKKIEGEYNPKTNTTVIDVEGLLDAGIKVSNPIEAATRRQQLTSNCQLFDNQLKNVKFDWILEWLKNSNEKVIIFSRFAKTIQYLSLFLCKNNIGVNIVSKEQNAVQREKTVENWNKNDDNRVLLGTFGVLGEGIDGLQEKCNYAMFIDRQWTASENEQAERRIFRKGQTKRCFFYILQCTGTIDIRVERVQLDKGHDAKQLLEPVDEKDE